MTKSDLIDTIAADTGLTKADVDRVLRGYERGITDALKLGQEVRLAGFGTFSRQDRPASEGRNPRTGEKIAIAAKRVVKFKPSKALSDALNG